MGALGVLAVALGALAGCGFEGRNAPGDGSGDDDGDDAPGDAGDDGDDIDADPDQPDADPEQPDAAGTPDATPGFDVALCPAEYDLTVSASPGTRYRFIEINRQFPAHHADCNDDHAGWTHLASFESGDEATLAAAFAPDFAYSYFGGVQDPAAVVPGAGWVSFGGGPMPIQWGFQAPDDGGAVENGDEQLVMIKEDGGIQDVHGLSDRFAICECDGHAIDATAAGYIPASL